MGILAMATADLQDMDIFASYTSASLSTNYARTGARSINLQSQITLSIPNTNEGYTRFACLPADSNTIVACDMGSYNGPEIRFHWTAGTATAAIYRYTNILLGSVGSVPGGIGQWTVFEIRWKIHLTTGIFQVKANGVEIFNFSGNTRNDLSDVVYLRLWRLGGTPYVDDWIIRDDQWPGRGGLHVLIPDAGTAVENWTASVGDPETCVDDLPPSFTDYVYTNGTVDGTDHRFNVASLPAGSWNIRGVGVFAKIKSDLPSDAFARTLIYSGVTEGQGPDRGIDSSPFWVRGYWETNPDDSLAWEDADIDAVQIGIESRVP